MSLSMQKEASMPRFTLGFIGCGNMGGAIAHGILASRPLRKVLGVAACDITDEPEKKLEKAGGRWFADPVSLAAACDLILLAVKPYQVKDVIQTILPVLTKDKTLLSIAAGQPLSALRAALDGRCAAVQIMPNTPALIGEGVFGLCLDDPALCQERKNLVRRIFEELGTVFILPENRMNGLMAVTGAGPAYVYDMMDAVMEAAVTLGIPRPDATAMVAALFRGAARMVEETGQHPAVLHSMVTSPGGSTVVGTNHLARTGVRGHIIDAVLAAAARGKEMESE